MASELQIVTITAESAPVPAISEKLIDLLDQLEACWSRFTPDSDISRLNLADGHPVQVDPSTITLVATMIEAWRATGQRFDPTTLPALMAAGYRSSIDDPRRITVLPTGALRFDDVDGDLDRPTLDDIEIDLDASTIRLPVGLTIDAGGIGKGLAADLAVDLALRSGADGAMVSIGGDIAAAGHSGRGGWRVVIEHPDPDREPVGTIEVAGGGVATSSTRSRRWRHEGVERHHLIDPWTGAVSNTDLASVTVIARSGWLAEAHATAAILAGSELVIDHLDRHELTGVAVTTHGDVLTTHDVADLAGPTAPSPTRNTVVTGDRS
jgi:thiamine biosynthesis lipoprotein